MALECIVVDDDEFSSKIISTLIGKTEDVELERSFRSASDAIDYLTKPKTIHTDIVFLDIEMPEMSGIDFMRSIDLSDTEVIIFSSQEKYALESYEYDVCDYLLKPVSYARFIKAIGKAQANLEQKRHAQASESAEGDAPSGDDGDVFFVKGGTGQVCKLRYDELVIIEAMENYVCLTTEDKKVFVHSPMKKIMDAMPEKFVVRIHRSYAVGLKYIVSVNKDSVTLHFGDKEQILPLSKTYRTEMKGMLSKATEWSK